MAPRSTRSPVSRLGATLAVALGAAGVAGGAAAGPGATSAAAAPLSCANGVVEVVDMTAFGGSITQSCDTAVTQDTTTGLEVLQSTGVTVDGTAAYGLAFVCRIGGQPADQDCQSTPPANAFWGYWHAAAGQDTWTFSNAGASTYHPALGSVEGWAFGNQAHPSLPPSAFRAPAPVPPAPATTLPRPTLPAPAAPTSVSGQAAPVPPVTSGGSGRPSGPPGPGTGGAGVTAAAAAAAGRAAVVSAAAAAASASRTAAAASAAADAGKGSPGASGSGASSAGAAPLPAGTIPGVDPTTEPTLSSPARLAPNTRRVAPIVDLATGSLSGRHPGAGSAGPAVVGAALVALVGLGAARTARQRRRTRDADG